MRKPRRIRNTSCIYTGRVGNPMRIRPRRGPTRRIHRKLVRLVDGPLGGHHLWLDVDSGLSTLEFTLRGQTGRYVGANWSATT